MKFQCPCGAKFAFDTSPEMVANPIKFACPTCGLDHSEFINQLIRREFNAPEPEYQRPVSEPPPEPPKPVSKLKISHADVPEIVVAPETTVPLSKYCSKHRGVLATEKCTTCQKPICPQCLSEFGFFCSPLCKNKADLQGIAAPVYAGQKFEVERRFWVNAGKIFAAGFGLLILALGAWAWYEFYGSWPHPNFSVRFADEDRAYAGGSALADGQLIFLHGGTLARYDLKAKNKIWSRELISPEAVATQAKVIADAQNGTDANGYSHRQTADDIQREVKIGLQRRLHLDVSGHDIWVRDGEMVRHYDWNTGEPRTENFFATGDTANPAAADSPGSSLAVNNGKPLDAERIAAEAQNLKLPARIALPALLANATYEAQLENTLRDDEPKNGNPVPVKKSFPAFTRLLPDGDGVVQFSVKMVRENFIDREAMKPAPKTSALDSDPSVGNSTAIVNEQLNEMQRNKGNDKVTEDWSTYEISVHLSTTGAKEFSTQVSGPPQLYVLKTVNVIAAGKTVLVLDKSNQKIWEASLTYPVTPRPQDFSGDATGYGVGPVAEHDGALYVFDAAVLSAFDVRSGNARWRVPSVGVVGLFFDDAGKIYVNTTSGNPDDIKYSKQIDIAKQVDEVLLKLDPADGKTLWHVKGKGFICYLSGQFLYTMEGHDPNPTDEDVNDMMSGLMKPAYLRLERLNTANGHVLWTHQQDRCPVDVEFTANQIQLIFKREVQVLKFLTF
jgi:endogenous inhibitor of DNA gyrase (YacG/DUF329 family)